LEEVGQSPVGQTGTIFTILEALCNPEGDDAFCALNAERTRRQLQAEKARRQAEKEAGNAKA
jgi:hypothetical protein